MHAPQKVLDEFFGPTGPASLARAHRGQRRRSSSPSSCASTSPTTWTSGSTTLLEGDDAARGRELAARLETAGYHLRMTRDLDVAKDYLFDRYAEAPDARYGLVASSRDKILEREWGIPNDWHSTQRLQPRPVVRRGRRRPALVPQPHQCVTEFGAQGLELDGVLLAWGTDLVRADGRAADGASDAGRTTTPSSTRAGARQGPLPAAPQRLPRAAHAGRDGDRHLRPARPAARRHRRLAAGAWGEGARLAVLGSPRRHERRGRRVLQHPPPHIADDLASSPSRFSLG